MSAHPTITLALAKQSDPMTRSEENRRLMRLEEVVRSPEMTFIATSM
jgi:hypothetical protein